VHFYQIFRVPLNRKEERMGGDLHSFYDSIGRPGRDPQRSDPAGGFSFPRGLMVTAVDFETGRSADVRQSAALIRIDRMGQSLGLGNPMLHFNNTSANLRT
jgi:hypothetical protein